MPHESSTLNSASATGESEPVAHDNLSTQRGFVPGFAGYCDYSVSVHRAHDHRILQNENLLLVPYT